MRKMIVVASLAMLVLLSAFVTRMYEDKPVHIPASPQRLGGDPKKGFEYLTTGDYVRSGVPYDIFLFGGGSDKNNYLHRDGRNATVPHDFTAIKAANGEILVAPNCLQCHAQIFEGQLIVGLGNSLVDFTKGPRLDASNFTMLENMLKARAPKQYEAAAPFITVSKAVAPYINLQTRGVNVADHLTALLAAHRDPVTFRWHDELTLQPSQQIVPTDTPPWWLLKKKNGMFYNGFGRGDFGRFLMASNLLTVNDTSESRSVDEHMPDMLAYIYSIEPPKYNGTIDQPLASKGRIIFERNCSSCHGTYGNKSSYPNLLIPESTIGTDSLLVRSNYSTPQFLDWFNKSWFTMGDHPAHLVPFNGYIAPPLDGIWVSAPYLHNGSVPTLEALLNSKLRPRYWSRNFDHPQYDRKKVGWVYEVKDKPGGKEVYNTDLPGYGNYGHYFGDALTDAERKAVIEYLKTL